ncbi:MAG: Crp/Fnr family transcriptional regulator [Dactylosporangium sp.]|nr:Crp/Fnr family transcriptional regulator [Dactylosporangium sp.]NNJ60315.1 Crp/Fnr family transcriptional regulator [Dactylosporangium sp.]
MLRVIQNYSNAGRSDGGRAQYPGEGRSAESGNSPEPRPYRFAAALKSCECVDLLAFARQQSFVEGQPLLRQGDTGSHIVILRKGQAKVIAGVDSGREVLLGLRGPGDLLGEMRYLSGQPRSASVVAAGPVAAVVLDFPSFDALLRKHERILGEIGRCIADRLCWADRRRLEFCLPVTVRIARVLYELGCATMLAKSGRKRPEESVGVEIPVTQRELGQLVGAAEVSVQKSLRHLAQRGCVTRHYGRVSIVHLDVLRAYTE